MLTEFLAPARLPHGQRIYAIGDPHGCVGRLEALHDRIAEHLLDHPVERATLIHLGDYVDRGPDSAAVIDLLLGPPPLHGMQVVNLVGNHEQMMLAALSPTAPDAVLDFWLDNGGGATLESYGLSPRDPTGWAAVPDDHLAFLRGCRASHAAGGYFFAHAGIRPDVPLAAQDVMDLTWIREPFLSWRGPVPAVVVHGHTPCKAPEIRGHRIGIDTGAVFGGDLTCAVLQDDRIGFLMA
ncbi:metallophosphoesterase family protein [Falsiroseomonas stagni]|uniref:Serine/threonine protein phosphatase 1 n=1 Tax=Falsiroseomonas stagni DSM 19981 TaxID=1123062 RepID=A0A1I3YEW4_9PROT|nr:metallophosphoesterase family protein [Falsiroseomonas stagni]SFK29736.1 serine/threonine protein phosphatase 1 [Falsiroseomonas stagni DSM 19981]